MNECGFNPEARVDVGCIVKGSHACNSGCFATQVFYTLSLTKGVENPTPVPHVCNSAWQLQLIITALNSTAVAAVLAILFISSSSGLLKSWNAPKTVILPQRPSSYHTPSLILLSYFDLPCTHPTEHAAHPMSTPMITQPISTKLAACYSNLNQTPLNAAGSMAPCLLRPWHPTRLDTGIKLEAATF